ncbi:MAG: phosphoribosylformylglycinamidine synthase subunit PurL [Thermomicrobiales bacterium]
MSIAEGQWREVALSDSEYAQIVELLGREPSIVELGMFGAMWSEHCGYKHSRPHLRTLPNDAPWVVQGPGENAGAVDIGNGLAAVFKVESHNHPSAVEPYEGAATGVGGIVRDIFTMNARPVAILDGLRFGPLDDVRNRYLFDNVVAGIGGYGNCLGIPTVGGEVFFDSSYNGNPLVNAMCVGIAPIDKIVRAKASGLGNVLVLIGAETGRDGLHGATFASVDDPEASHRGVIQVGNPFLEKQLMEACLELFKGDAVVAMQDLGAAGLTSSVVECASRGGVGVEIDVQKVPRRETGMTAYEVMLSESQERMVLVAPPERVPEITAALDHFSLSSAVIGTITDDGIVRIKDGESVEVEVPVTFFIDECPVYEPKDAWQPEEYAARAAVDVTAHEDLMADDLLPAVERMMTSPNIGSRREVYEQYDHTILTNTVIGPGRGDAAVLRVKGTPTGIAASLDCNSRYCYLDPYVGAQHAVAEAARNVSAVGGTPLAITNCLNFGNPERRPGNWQLAEAVRGMGDACRALGIPVVSGNVSLYNETAGVPVFPTPMVGCVGDLDDVSKTSAMQWGEDQDIVLLGSATPTLGGSEYLAWLREETAGAPPAIDLAVELTTQTLVRELVAEGKVEAVHDIGLGGLAIALAEMALGEGVGHRIGATIHTPPTTSARIDETWFGEAAGRFLVSVSPDQTSHILAAAQGAGIAASVIGRTGPAGSPLDLAGFGSLDLDRLQAASDSALRSSGVVANV